MIRLPRLYAIADASFGNPATLAGALFDGGARLVQIRSKEAGARELLAQVETTLKAAPPGVRVLVNDRVDVALLTRAHGVHLGQDDLPPAHGRNILGENFVIGLSTHNMEQALEANQMAVDYIAVGPVYATATKKDPDPVLGIETLQQICCCVEKPVVAIGGITIDTAQEVFAAGAASVAVISDLLRSDSIAGRVRAWLERYGE
jgi:thiamine-phosphate pyrophosphorylase